MSIFKYEKIDGAGICPVYLERWTLFKCRWFQIYLHKFSGDDWAIDGHDHPKRFISIGLKGSYDEEIFKDGELVGEKKWIAPWFRSFPADHTHRIKAKATGGAWTLVIVGRANRPWGFWLKGEWIPWRKYVYEHGEERKSC